MGGHAMSILFHCSQCSGELDADDELAGQIIDCPHCGKTCTVPTAESQELEKQKLRLKRAVQKQAVENLAPAGKTCPKCKQQLDARALICVRCGYNFRTRAIEHGGSKKHRLAGLFSGATGLLFRLILLAALVGAGFYGFVWVQEWRYADQISAALQRGELGEVIDKYRKLASWHSWFEPLGVRNPYALRSRQFQVRQGKTYTDTRNHTLPFVVDKSVWGTQAEINSRTAWIRFRIANLREEPLTVSQEMFLLIGVNGSVAMARTELNPDPGQIQLQKGEAVQGALFVPGMLKPPAFLEYNDGETVVRTPVYANFALDNYSRDQLDWPDAGAPLNEFPFTKPWSECKLTAEAVHRLWNDYASLKPPPAEPYTTVFREANPR